MKKNYITFATGVLLAATTLSAQNTGPQILDPEPLDRGVVVIPASSGGMLVNWRSLVTDQDSVTFNIIKNGEETVFVSKDSRCISYIDPDGVASDTYKLTVKKNKKTVERPASHYFPQGHLDLQLDRPAGGTLEGTAYTYKPGDASVGDVDGDGEYEIILKWDPTNQQDNSLGGITGNVYIDCYKLNGTKLWRIDLGRNIRAGAHYTQFMVYDLDGDGKAEVACKTAPGTIDGLGDYVLMGNDDPKADYRGTYKGNTGIVKSGPEYLTVFSGLSGAALSTVAYEPARSVLTDSEWGDTYANRCERYLACVAYLDGRHPSLVMCRGYYTASYLCAWDFDGTQLTKRWLHASTTKGQGAYGEGAHSLSVGDVDGDGCDEIVYGSACIDHDGSLLYRTGFGHGDALHLGDFDPDQEGLEVWMVHEEKGSGYPWDSEFRNAKTGKVYWGLAQSGNDIGRGLCADIDSTRRGIECWPIGDYSDGNKNGAVFTCTGKLFSTSRPSVNFATYFKNNRYQQALEEGKLDEWTGNGSKNLINFVSKYGCGVGLIKNVPCIQADILGDWREELVFYDAATCSKLMVFTSPYPTTDCIPTFMHDHLYRMSIVWQNNAYNQPPHLSYYLPEFDYDLYLKKVKDDATDLRSMASTAAGHLTITPQMGGVKLTCSGLQGRAIQIDVTALDGCSTYSGACHLDGNASISLDSNAFAGGHGLFFISVTTEEGRWTKKVIR